MAVPSQAVRTVLHSQHVQYSGTSYGSREIRLGAQGFRFGVSPRIVIVFFFVWRNVYE